MADPGSDACWDVSQHGGQSVLAAEEAGRSLQRQRDEESLKSPQLLCPSLSLVLRFEPLPPYLLLAVGVADAGHMRVCKQEVEGDGQEGQVSHEGEILAVQDDVVHPVGEGEPVQGLAHTVQVGVSDAHGQVVIMQTLRRRHRRVPAHLFVCFHDRNEQKRRSSSPGRLFHTLHWTRPSAECVGTSELHCQNLEPPQSPRRYAS